VDGAVSVTPYSDLDPANVLDAFMISRVRKGAGPSFRQNRFRVAVGQTEGLNCGNLVHLRCHRPVRTEEHAVRAMPFDESADALSIQCRQAGGPRRVQVNRMTDDGLLCNVQHAVAPEVSRHELESGKFMDQAENLGRARCAFISNTTDTANVRQDDELALQSIEDRGQPTICEVVPLVDGMQFDSPKVVRPQIGNDGFGGPVEIQGPEADQPFVWQRTGKPVGRLYARCVPRHAETYGTRHARAIHRRKQ
jgi:hypothetical protein